MAVKPQPRPMRGKIETADSREQGEKTGRHG
jgi:hypothetical protein